MEAPSAVFEGFYVEGGGGGVSASAVACLVGGQEEGTERGREGA